MTQRAEQEKMMLKGDTVENVIRTMVRNFAEHSKRQPLDWSSFEIAVKKTHIPEAPVAIYIAINLL